MTTQDNKKYYCVASTKYVNKKILDDCLSISKYLNTFDMTVRLSPYGKVERIFKLNTHEEKVEWINPIVDDIAFKNKGIELISELGFSYINEMGSLPLLDLAYRKLQLLLGKYLNRPVEFLIVNPKEKKYDIPLCDNTYMVHVMALRLGIKVYNIREQEVLEHLLKKAGRKNV